MTAKSLSVRQKGQILLRYGSVEAYNADRLLRKWKKEHPEPETIINNGRTYVLRYSGQKVTCQALSRILRGEFFVRVRKQPYKDEKYKLFLADISSP